MMTQAFLLTRTGSADNAFTLADIELAPLQENEVLIESEAFGLNYADVMIRRGLYSERPKLPCVLGYEIVGTIIQTGQKEDRHLIGTRVVALTQLGAYAQHVIAHIDRVCPIGDEIHPNTALALTLQGVTACYMSRYIAPVRKGEKVLIHAAAGGVGTWLIQLAKHAGATVIAKVSSEQKRQHCLALGADFAINYYTSHDYVAEVENLIGKHQIDVSFNPVGGKTYRQDSKLLGAGSKMLLFGGSELMTGKLGALSKLWFLIQMGVVIPIFQSIYAKSLLGINILQLMDSKPHVIQHCLAEMVELCRQGIITPQNGGDFYHTELEKAHALLESGQSSGKLAVYWQAMPAIKPEIHLRKMAS